MKKVILYIWQLPQNLLGLLLRAIYKGNDSVYEDAIVRRSLNFKDGVSLGKYIVINQFARKDDVKHEYGHSIQSKRWGWFYLPVIGLFSLIHYLFCKCAKHNYTDVLFERQADSLGGVKR